MDKEKLKLIVRNLKLLVESLESEILSDPSSYVEETVFDEFGEDAHKYYYDPNGNDFDEIYAEGYGSRYRIMNDDDGDGL